MDLEFQEKVINTAKYFPNLADRINIFRLFDELRGLRFLLASILLQEGGTYTIYRNNYISIADDKEATVYEHEDHNGDIVLSIKGGLHDPSQQAQR